MISEDHVTQDWSNDAENTDHITEINYILTNIQQLFDIVTNISLYNFPIYFLLYLWSNKCSLGEQKIQK